MISFVKTKNVDVILENTALKQLILLQNKLQERKSDKIP